MRGRLQADSERRCCLLLDDDPVGRSLSYSLLRALKTVKISDRCRAPDLALAESAEPEFG